MDLEYLYGHEPADLTAHSVALGKMEAARGPSPVDWDMGAVVA